MAIGIILYLAFIVFLIISAWKVFEKAGRPGWEAIIPIYNFYMIAKLSGQKNWWLIFIPIANIYIAFVVYIAFAKSFGKSAGFGIGMMFLGFIFWPILGFGDAKYIGPNGAHEFKEDVDAIGRN